VFPVAQLRMTDEPRKLPYIVLVVDGIIGAGKTTLIQDCLVPILSEWGLRITVVPEPVEKWKVLGRLEQFYEDPSRRGYQFQTRAFHDRVKTSQEIHRKYAAHTDVFLLERSVFTDLLFMKTLRESQTIDETEYEDYLDLWTMWEEVMPFRPDLFVYLKPDVDVAMKRLQERNRDGESTVSKDYQVALEEKHDEFLGGDYVAISDSHYVPCFHLSTNSNFRDDDVVKKEIASKFLDKISHIRNVKAGTKS